VREQGIYSRPERARKILSATVIKVYSGGPFISVDPFTFMSSFDSMGPFRFGVTFQALFRAPDSTQLNSTSSENVQNSANWAISVILSCKSVQSARRALNTLTTQLNSTQFNSNASWVELSWVESGGALWTGLYWLPGRGGGGSGCSAPALALCIQKKSTLFFVSSFWTDVRDVMVAKPMEFRIRYIQYRATSAQ